MSTTAIVSPLPGERVLAQSPQNAAEAAATWLRRPNLFPGRTLTAPTLDGRQRWAAGRLAQRGQAYTAGIVHGLELGYTSEPAPTGSDALPRVRLHLAAGRGLAVSGEDVVLARGLDADLFGAPVVAPPGLFDPESEDEGPEPGGLRARRIGEHLGRILTDNPAALPRVGVLVLQPVTVDRSGIDPEDPCDRCGCGTAGGGVSFEDWRLADAARLLWYAWPDEWRPLPADTARLRNTLAYTIFDAEAALFPGEVLPWEEYGVPVALIALADDFQPRFADAAAVVRQGGRARVGRLQLAQSAAGARSLTPNPRLPTLWQAQIMQLAEQIAEFGEPAPAAATLTEAFGRLPPCGLLPTNVFDPTAQTSAFFPAAFDLDAAPVPLDQLDLALREAAGLTPLDFALGERVRILVPVNQASWDPRLLYRETLAPEFDTTLDRFLAARARALGLRQGLRTAVARLLRSVTGQLPEVPAFEADPLALEIETLTPWGPPPPTGGHRSQRLPGLHEHFFDTAPGPILTVGADDSLYVWVYLDPDAPPRELMFQWLSDSWEHRAYWGENLIEIGTDGSESRLPMGPLPPPGQWLRLQLPAAAVGLAGQALIGMAFTLFDGRAAFGSSGWLTEDDTVETLWFAAELPPGARRYGNEPWEFLAPDQLWMPFEPDFGIAYADEIPEAGGIATLQSSAALAPLSEFERGQLRTRGLEGFIRYLASRTDRADDLIDYGFLKVQTDIYRVRQFMLGTSAANKLIVSPTLATIAQSETAIASQEKITTFFENLRGGAAARARAGAGIAEERLPPIMQSGVATGASAATAPRSRAFSAEFVRRDTVETVRETVGIRLGAGAEAAMVTEQLQLRPIFTDFITAEPSTEIAPVRAPTPVFSPSDVTNARPVVGQIDFRTTTLAERLVPLPAAEARNYATASRHEMVLGLIRLADELRAEDGDVTPGLFQGIDLYGLANDPFLETAAQQTARSRSLADFLAVGPARSERLRLLLSLPAAGDESSHFSDSTSLSDATIALLRQVEGRVRLYRDAIAACEATLGTIRQNLATAQLREREADQALAEGRHDVAVTRALIAEEQQRLDAINQRRAAVLAEEVRFLAYVRLRTTDNLASAPARAIDPGLFEAPLPACLGADFEIPDELSGLLQVVREAPAGWFVQGPQLIGGLDRIELLARTLQTAQLRTQLAAIRPVASNGSTSLTGLSASIAQLAARQSQVVGLARSAALQIDVARFASLSWLSAQAQAAQVVSIGDLIDGEHGRSDLVRSAAEFFDRFGRVCACLYASFSAVLPSLRLDWAEQLSQFDAAPNLRNLASLPRWQEIDVNDRRRMQGYVDWLYAQIDTHEASAASLINDIVRMALLLASHAPVNRLIAGRLPRPVIARPGITIPLIALEPSRLHVGMQALVYRANEIVARAVVEDIGSSEASARVLTATGNAVELDQNVRVQFSAAASLSFSSAAMRLF